MLSLKEGKSEGLPEGTAFKGKAAASGKHGRMFHRGEEEEGSRGMDVWGTGWAGLHSSLHVPVVCVCVTIVMWAYYSVLLSGLLSPPPPVDFGDTNIHIVRNPADGELMSVNTPDWSLRASSAFPGGTVLSQTAWQLLDNPERP